MIMIKTTNAGTTSSRLGIAQNNSSIVLGGESQQRHIVIDQAPASRFVEPQEDRFVRWMTRGDASLHMVQKFFVGTVLLANAPGFVKAVGEKK
jgi:hypothetical protein